MNIVELLQNMKEGQMAKATFAEQEWEIIYTYGTIRYFYNSKPQELVPLSYTNINASYEIL